MAGAHENDGNSPDDLPDFPEEWGVIVIPDDLSELSDEVETVRAELRQSERSHRWRRVFDRPGLRQLRRAGIALLRAPVLIISMAVLVTVASLFASAWPGPPRQPVVQRTDDDRPDALPALDLVGDDGQMVPLRAKLPAVVLVTDGCDCAALISATAAAAQARPQIAVVVIAAALSNATSGSPSGTTGSGPNGTASGGPSGTASNGPNGTASNGPNGTASNGPNGTASGTASGGPSTRATPATQTTPQATASAKPVEVLHNPPGNSVRDQLKLGPPDGTAAALLVDGKGRVVREFKRTASVDDLQPYLARI